MFYDGSFNAKTFLTFIKRLIKDNNMKVFLIVDNLRSHHAIIVTDWLELHRDEIEVFFLPPYCPEYNPDEYLNGNLKREMEKENCAKTKIELEAKARKIVRRIQSDKPHVARLFYAKYVMYAK